MAEARPLSTLCLFCFSGWEQLWVSDTICRRQMLSSLCYSRFSSQFPVLPSFPCSAIPPRLALHFPPGLKHDHNHDLLNVSQIPELRAVDILELVSFGPPILLLGHLGGKFTPLKADVTGLLLKQCYVFSPLSRDFLVWKLEHETSSMMVSVTGNLKFSMLTFTIALCMEIKGFLSEQKNRNNIFIVMF